MKLRTRIATGIAAGVMLLSSGGAIGASMASASGTPVLKTVTRTDKLVSPTCYYEYQVTRTYYHWSTKDHRYVAYPAGPRVTTLSQKVCHK